MGMPGLAAVAALLRDPKPRAREFAALHMAEYAPEGPPPTGEEHHGRLEKHCVKSHGIHARKLPRVCLQQL